MTRYRLAAAVAAIALLSFFQFPGHTWLQQDTQIYEPVLEHQYDPSVLQQDMLVQHPHVAFTFYDEIAVGLRRLTGLGFREILAFQQIVTRALGIWGIYLMAGSLGFAMWPSLVIAAVVSLGANVAGPQVLSFEYEPTPRAFAVPLLFCAMGLATQGRYWAAEAVGVGAILYHAPTVVPFWIASIPILIVRRRYWSIVPAGVVFLLVFLVARAQGAANIAFFSRLSPSEEHLQVARASYAWISTWPAATIIHYVGCFAVVLAGLYRLKRELTFELRIMLFLLPLFGVLSMPVSWLLLDRGGWSLMPQFQPMRMLLFVDVAMQFLGAAAGVRAVLKKRRLEAFLWFVAAYVLPVQPILTVPVEWPRVALVLALAAATAAARRFAPGVALAAFFAIPGLGHVVNYPNLHTKELAQLSGWARVSTPKDAVFFSRTPAARSIRAFSAPRLSAPSMSTGKAAARSTTSRASGNSGGSVGRKRPPAGSGPPTSRATRPSGLRISSSPRKIGWHDRSRSLRTPDSWSTPSRRSHRQPRRPQQVADSLLHIVPPVAQSVRMLLAAR